VAEVKLRSDHYFDAEEEKFEKPEEKAKKYC